MPRRPPSRVRAVLARPSPTAIRGVPLSTSRALDRLDRLELCSQRIALELATWRRVVHLPVATLRREHNDWAHIIGPLARNTLEEGICALTTRQGAPLRKAVRPMDELFAAKTLPDPLADPSSPWWCRRC